MKAATMETLDYDIIVAGGGSAGSAAAISAARRGHRVLLIEEQNCLGGISSSGGVGEWFASLAGMGDIFAATVQELDKFGARYADTRFFNGEYLKNIWQFLAEQAGVNILFHASVCTVGRQDDTIIAVRISCCSQMITARARYFIDATGEGDIAALAGAEFMQGNPQGKVLHMTLTAWLYDTGKKQQPYLPASLTPITSADELPGLGGGFQIDDRRVYLNATKVMGHDPTDPFSLSQAECEARRQLVQILHYLQTYQFPTYALASSGAKIGIREGRRIHGDHILSRIEVVDRNEPLDFADGIAVATSQIDFHSLNKAGSSGWRQRLEPYSIPLRCLLARGLTNLLVAGKCISTDQVVQSSCRMTPTCCAMGQAAGTAAAMAVEINAADIRAVPVEKLRSVLAAEGMQLDPGKHAAFAPHATRLDADDNL